MTCEDVREQLLTGDTFDAAHLERCPECAKLADLIRATEDELRDYVDAFSVPTNLDAQWARALEAAGPQRRWSLHALLLLAAAAAVVLLVVVPRVNDGPASAPPALVEAVALADRFDALPLDGFDLDGLDRKAQDQLLAGAQKEKAAAMSEAEQALLPLLEEGEPRWRVEAALELGDLYARMGDALHEMQRPTWLNAKQRAAYDAGYEKKTQAQWQKALDTWALGAEIAWEHGLEEQAAELEALADELRPGEDGCREFQVIVGGRKKVVLVDEDGLPCDEAAEADFLVLQTAAKLDRCEDRLAPEAVAEAREVLATERDLDVLRSYADALEEACAE